MDYSERLDKLLESKDNDSLLSCYTEMSDYYEECVSQGFGTSVSTERATLNKSGLKVLDVISQLNDERQIKKIVDSQKDLSPQEKAALKNATTRRKLGQTTKGLNTTKGKYTSKRLALHKKIINQFISGKSSQKTPTVLFLAGVGGSGKSTALKAMGIDKNKSVLIDADEIKKLLPEFSKEHHIGRAQITHDESSDVAKKIIEASINKRLNLIIDGTMKNTNKSKEIINKAKRKGYITEMVGTQLPTHKAMERNMKRYLDSEDIDKRYVPAEVVKDMGKKVNKSIHSLKKNFDKYSLYNTDVPMGKPPILVEKSRKK